MLATSLVSLHSAPGLSRGELDSASQGEPWLDGSDIAQDLESVKFTLGDLSLDDLSKLWSIFFQTPYRLSVGYAASVVLIEADIAAREPLPVRQGRADALPVRQPMITRVRAVGDGNAVVGVPARLEILGRNLRGPRTAVRFDNGDPRTVNSATDSTVVVSAEGLPAGVHGIQIVHEILIGDPPVPHRGVESAATAFVLRPDVRATFDPAGPGNPADAFVVTFAPPLGVRQRLSLLLNEYVDPLPTDRALRFYRLAPETAITEGAARVRFPRGEVASGTYVVRAQVDGAESPLDFHPGEQPPIPPTPRVIVP
jgi:hypothetical protein